MNIGELVDRRKETTTDISAKYMDKFSDYLQSNICDFVDELELNKEISASMAFNIISSTVCTVAINTFYRLMAGVPKKDHDIYLNGTLENIKQSVKYLLQEKMRNPHDSL